MSDTRADEQLVEAFYENNNDVFDILFHRHVERVRALMRGKSWFKDDDQYLDELVGQAFEVLWQCLKDRKFKTQGAGNIDNGFFKAFIKFSSDKLGQKTINFPSAAIKRLITVSKMPIP